jgi:hypothetical protein
LLSKQNSPCLLVEEENCIKLVGIPADKKFSVTSVSTDRSLRVSNSSLAHGLSNSPICNTKVVKAFFIVMESLCFVTASANRSLLKASLSYHCKSFDVHKTLLYVINFNNTFSPTPMSHKCLFFLDLCAFIFFLPKFTENSVRTSKSKNFTN